MMRLSDNKLIPQYKKLVEIIHAEDCAAICQLALGAFYKNYVEIGENELSMAEVENIIKMFVDAAIRAEICGFDGVQIHAAHFFFLSRFISPKINHRTDKFGGSIENRAEILLEILRGIKKSAPKLHVTIKINSSDFVYGGLEKEESLKICKMLEAAGIDFIYAQTNDALGEIETYNTKIGKKELIGSWNERFSYTDEDIDAYLDFATKNYRNVILAGHSLGANKVIYYLARHHDKNRVKKFILMSPANLTHMMSGVSDGERDFIEKLVRYGRGDKILPFYFMGWVLCTANTAHDWLSGVLDNTSGKNFDQLEQITHSGALIIGTFDTFTNGDPVGFLKMINSHMPTAQENKLVFIEQTGHTYQQKHKEIAEIIKNLALEWRSE